MPECDNGAWCQRIRQDIRASLTRYVTEGIPTGDFLTAVLTNNLAQAVGRADEDNYATLREIVAHVWNCLPSGCWGSPDKVTAWMKAYQTKVAA